VSAPLVALWRVSARDRILLDSWNATTVPNPPGQTVVSLFRQQAARTPNALAVQDSEHEQTYAQLAEAVDAVARGLVAAGIRPGDTVGVQGCRGVAYLGVLLGVLAAGCVYLPLDPSDPAERNGRMVERTGCVRVIDVDAGFVPDAERAALPQLSPEDPAYVIFTSGSTGEPKGALVSHRGLLNHLLAKIELLRLSSSCVVAQTARLSFDVSIWQFLAALLVGGRIVILDATSALDPRLLARSIRQTGVTELEVVPSWLRVIIDAVDRNLVPAAAFAGMSTLLVTGETFAASLYEAACRIWPNLRVVNAYGPAECSDDVAHWASSGRLSTETLTAPIGKPIRNTGLHVVDETLCELPVGTPGELVVTGSCVGLGYVGDPQRTAQSFVTAPLGAGHTDVRCYRTGDVARWLPSGDLEFIGRRDRQVKIRGARIEIGEVENALRQLATVADAVVVTQQMADQAALVAYVTAPDQVTLDPEQLRVELRRLVPEQMVPQHIFQLVEFPLTAHGKIDFTRLTAAEPAEVVSTPATELTADQARLAAIWSAVLDVTGISPDSDFFDLGGDSLRAVNLCSRLSVEYGVRWPVQKIFTCPTLRAMTGALTSSDSVAGVTDRKPTRESGGSVGTFRRVAKSLVDSIRSGAMPRVLGASLGYIPDLVPAETGLEPETIRQEWFFEHPQARSVYETPFGRLVHVTLPMFASELYADSARTAAEVRGGVALAASLGARAVSLTGLLPSATDLGRCLGPAGDVTITTGHNVTAASVALAVCQAEELAGRRAADERLAVLGLGSIGVSSLRLLLNIGYQPHSITLCDVFGMQHDLEVLAATLRDVVGYRGQIRLLASRGRVPDELYEASVILGATNVANILDVAALWPGTIIIDDSSPHCFVAADALQRIDEEGDLLVCEAGLLRMPGQVAETRFVPGSPGPANPYERLSRFAAMPDTIMGCTVSGLLVASGQIDPVLGSVSTAAALRAFRTLRQIGVTAAPPSCQDRVFSSDAITGFQHLNPANSKGESRD
jgi:amino acid adenylation domain-containing protein